MRRQAMWTYILSVALFVVSSSSAAEPESRWPELGGPVLQVIGAINDLRLAAGLEVVQADTLWCHGVVKGIRRSIDELGDSFFDNSVWPGELSRRVEDWENQCFLVTAGSIPELYDKLVAMPGFTDAALSPAASHVVAAIGDRRGEDAWCAVWVIHRLVHLDPLKKVEHVYRGPSSLTFSGVSQYKHLLVKSYRDEGTATVEEQDTDSVALETDEFGAFRVTLRFLRPGPAEYQIIIYVKEEPSDEYKPAARTRFSVPAPSPETGPATIKRVPAPADSPRARSN